MEKFLKWIEEKLMPPMAKLSEQRHLKAIRDGVISTLSLIIVGSFFLIIAQPPIKAWADAIAPNAWKLMIPYRLTMGLMSVYAAYGMGYSLAKSYKLDGISGGVLSLSAFLLATIPVNIDTFINEATKAGVKGGTPLGWVLPMANLGGAGMFVAIICMIFAVETLRFLKKHNVTIKMPEQVPESVSRSFEALIPAAIIITVIWFIRVWLNFDIQKVIMNIFKPLVNVAGNSLGGVLIPVIFITLLWTAGIHGMSVIGSIVRPVWLVLLEANTKAVAAGEALPNIAPEPFFQWFIWIGGAGATLSLAILMCFSKSEYLKRVGRFSIIPGIFNINEPLIFGTPLVMNPILAIPFILGPVVAGVIAYIATAIGLVSKVYVLAPWTLPAPIGAIFATGGDLKAGILVIINIIVVALIYYPFFKIYEKRMIKEEQEQRG
ncbi:PTS system, cellobiose-specific IIC component [Clostridium sp. USBA 49]|uniref:PTS sugar transporter subunit IIC n=1 Tax=Clostridium sp. USBA 49 TaxID=1881060 RepID=UPI00099A2E3C|nr:PTS sugar transporter subunit IIC [Clostridium sp. USBA 49]SKA82933.1 PTS system, cellobiose-specific IIC component [Clostridium sp. USBA 49]